MASLYVLVVNVQSPPTLVVPIPTDPSPETTNVEFGSSLSLSIYVPTCKASSG